MTAPRPTRFQRKQQDRRLAALKALFADDEFAAVFAATGDFVRLAGFALGATEGRGRRLREAGRAGDGAIMEGHRGRLGGLPLRALFEPLLAAAKKASPPLAHHYSDAQLQAFLASLVAARVAWHAAPTEREGYAGAVHFAGQGLPVAFERLLPDNPARLRQTPDGKTCVEWPAGRHERRHALEVASYVESLSAAEHPVGRPRGAAKPKGSGRRRIPLDRARAVRRMRRAGATYKEIALRHYPHLKPDSAAARNQARRDIERADLAD